MVKERLHSINNMYGCVSAGIHFLNSLALLDDLDYKSCRGFKETMSEKLPSKDEALEALDFIVNVLKEHEKDLDKLVNELATVADQMGESGELNGKVKQIEDKIGSLQDNVGNIVKSLSSSKKEVAVNHVSETSNLTSNEELKYESLNQNSTSGVPLLLKCKQWEDFLSLASQAQSVFFAFKEAEKTFEADALRNNQVVTFSGEMPSLSSLLKMFLSRQLNVTEKQVMEGDMTLG